MAQVTPFPALRFTEKAGLPEQLTCPPYDIISEQQRRNYLEENPNNIIRLELPQGENCYQQAADTLKDWLNTGILKQDEIDSFYIYQESFQIDGVPYQLKGVIGRVTLEEFEKGIILPHEETLSKAKEDRFNLMKATGCNFSQVYSLYHDEEGEITHLLNQASQGEPLVSFTATYEVTHSLWKCDDPQLIQQISRLFADKKLYIADGHHRYETALNYRNWLHEQGIGLEQDHPANKIMMMLVNMENPGLVVLPTHRIVRGLTEFSIDQIVDKAKENFEIAWFAEKEKAEHQMREEYVKYRTTFLLYHNHRYTLFTLKNPAIMDQVFPEKSKTYRNLDVAVLHSLILEKILGIDKENMAQQINLTYTRSKREAIQAVDSGEANCCVLLNPTRVEEIRDVATAGEKMPQKSTYFYPKLITGLVMNKIL
ncbi:DUF1015 domain-containing protein [Massilioclostridium coli]|uniref:DUF1015 domain-containing protein n=1 Tax=Massilioclostridium coli TaxID=1870991 RepID=UPI00085C1BE5|nr:DUF1015 domain-containing protein [Massilioclostridium coli]